MIYGLFLAVVNECALGFSNCEQVCEDTIGSYICSCNPGYVLAPDGHSCQCGGRLTAASGSFQTPGWPTSYPLENFQCEWIIDTPCAESIEFTVDDSAFGINGRNPCSTDHIEFFDGTGGNAGSLLKLCGHKNFYDFASINTTSSQARVVFTGSSQVRPASRVGVKVDYSCTAEVNECLNNNGGCDQICVNTASSLECQCRRGYQLQSDRRSCTG